MALTITAALATAVDTAATNAAAAAYATAIGASSIIRFYTGAKPSTPETAASGTLLATVAITGSWTAASDGSGGLTAANPAAVTVGTSGLAGYFRLLTSGATAILDGTVGTSGTDIILDNANLVASGLLDLGVPVLTIPVTVPVV
jgi:hypothetical protein